MHRVISILEKALVFIVILAFIGKARHFGSASLILVLSMMLLSILYFPLGYFTLGNNKTPLKGTLMAVLAGLSLSLATLGILFKCMIWPGADVQLYAGLAGISIFMILYLLFRFKVFVGWEDFFNKNYLRISIYFKLCLLILFVPTETRIRFQYPGAPEAYVRLRTAYETHPEIDSIQNAYFNYGKHIDSVMQKAQMRKAEEDRKK